LYVGQPNDFFVICLLKEKLSTIAYESPRHPSNEKKYQGARIHIFGHGAGDVATIFSLMSDHDAG